VPDGSKIEDLGINFRQITRDLLSRYVDRKWRQSPRLMTPRCKRWRRSLRQSLPRLGPSAPPEV
jgi:hypothetical protein